MPVGLNRGSEFRELLKLFAGPIGVEFQGRSQDVPFQRQGERPAPLQVSGRVPVSAGSVVQNILRNNQPADGSPYLPDDCAQDFLDLLVNALVRPEAEVFVTREKMPG